ncbi:MAG: B12-binding domain-containing radical SAM protein [Candidatus Omnitrophica bacterium]|nr:B12-binding domain-containing radical SAM protein [Candidatus Omnitrophota bacterium]
MKIVFIKPNMISGTPGDSMEPLVFAILSALTPPEIERCLYDERIEKIPDDISADLIVLTADVFSAKRAYQIAYLYRQKGIPVVLGGFHPTLCPEEASQYADSIVIGDAEDTWPQIIADAKNNRLQRRYVSTYPPFGKHNPDRSLFQGKSYAPIRLIEFNRGCRFFCDFCSIRAMYQGKIRRQSQENVLRDIGNNRKQHLFFTDDNFYADMDHLKDVLYELGQRDLKWSCQISSDIIKYPELVALMAKAGCVSVTIGFESLDQNNLKQMGKAWMEDDYIRIINVFHDNGIMVYGTFIIGYDYDTPDIFERTLNFALDNHLFLANFNPLIPMPGTPLYLRLKSEGRLLFDCWWIDKDYRWGDSVFRPRGMSPKELTAGCFQLRKRFNSTRNILARFPGLKIRNTNLYKAGLFVIANLVSRKELYRKYGQALGDSSSADEFNFLKSDGIKCE